MEKYYCTECGAVHTEDELEMDVEYDNGDGGYGNPMYATFICPECGSEDLVEAVECPVCGEWHDPDDGEICADCKKDISALWLNLLGNFPDGADAGAVATYIAEVLV